MKRFCLIILIVCTSISWSCAHKPSQPLPSQQILEDPTVEQSYKDAIRQKRVIPGMTHDMVEAIHGPPHAVNYSVFDDGTQAEIWVYRPSLARQALSAQYGLSTQYLYIAFKEDKVVRVFNDIRTPNVIIIPR
ncbi:MAG: hypothetical protein FJ123_01390 [Deltaproteobacteria bacterium]|nr:hypothetical protein [Deltaproteobacteria bacterium]